MDTILKLSLPNKKIKDIFGVEKFELLKQKLMEDKLYTCTCCGWEGGKEIENREHLTIHIDSFNENEPNQSVFELVCKSCYLINHIDDAVKFDFIKFVNSIYPQETLTKISWSDCSKKTITGSNRNKAIEDGKIIILNDDKLKYLDAIKNGVASKYLKVIFTDKFLKS